MKTLPTPRFGNDEGGFLLSIATSTPLEVIYLVGIPINIEGVFQSFDSNGVLLVPDPNQSQTRKGKTEMSSTWSTTL